MDNQFAWHKKPVGEKLCPICGCSGVRAGVQHRALKAEESWRYGSLWVKKVSACFGLDQNVVTVKQ